MSWLIGYEQLAIAAGATRRMLQHWHDEGLVTASIEGHKKLYTQEQAVQVVVIAELRRQEVTLQEIRAAIEPIKAELRRQAKKLPECYLAMDLTKGTIIATPHMHTLSAALTESQGARWCVIFIGDLVARLPQSPRADRRTAA